MNDSIKKHYQDLFEKHGMAPESVQYISKDSQYRRFEVLAGIDANMTSAVDLGSGLGDMYDYLKNQLKNPVNYLGLDFVNEFVESASERFKNDSNANFRVFDGLKDLYPVEYDYYLLRGVFNNKVEGNEAIMIDTVAKMFEACKKGVAFNAMSTYVDYCKKNLTRKVVLRHEYLVKENSIPFEFTVYLYK